MNQWQSIDAAGEYTSYCEMYQASANCFKYIVIPLPTRFTRAACANCTASLIPCFTSIAKVQYNYGQDGNSFHN